MENSKKLNTFKLEAETLNENSVELTKEEIAQMAGGTSEDASIRFYTCYQCGKRFGRVGTTANTVTCKCGGTAGLDEIWNY